METQTVTIAKSAWVAGVFLLPAAVLAAEPMCPNGSNPDPRVIWCDGFESSDLGPGGTIGEKYFEYDDDNGEFGPTTDDSFEGNSSLAATWQPGEIDAGNLKLNFGRSPLPSQAATGSDFREIFWRFYVKMEGGFQDYADKLTRATIFANSNWAQAMAAHLWHDSSDRAFLLLDPVSGIDSGGNLVTTGWNDFGNFIWLGGAKAATPLQDGQWYCVEAHVALNDPASANGVFEFWLDGELEARKTGMNWVGSWTDYGINSVFLETYWNDGSPAEQTRYFDAFVVSTERIGCIDDVRPLPPVLNVQ